MPYLPVGIKETKKKKKKKTRNLNTRLFDFLSLNYFFVLIDFSKAFDSVSFDILLQKLSVYFGFGVHACQLMATYLNGRSQFVSSMNAVFSMKNNYSGVPQGSILGPILFCAFTNDIINCCQSTSIHLYADDAQIYLSRPLGLFDDLFYQLNEDLEAICKWSKTNRFLINTAKTQVMCVHHSPTLVNIPRIMMNNAVITHVSSVFWQLVKLAAQVF